MVKLFCALVGVNGNAFSVTIDASESVDELKEAIQKKKPNKIKCDADELQLFLAKKDDNTWLESSTDDVKKLKKGEKTALIEALTHEDNELQGESGLQKVLKDMPEPSTDQIHVLVVVPEQEPTAATRQIFTSYRPHAEGINLQLPHLSREELVEKLYYALTKTNFVLLSAPAGSGKTSLLTLFARQHPELRYVPIAFDDSNANAADLLTGHGVDVVQKTCRIPGDKMCVFMLDDCQRQYHDIAFWTALIKGSSSWLLPHIRFVISATHLLETDAPESPIAFGSIPWKVTRDDFLISDEEAHQFFNFENGLPSQLRFPTLVEVIIRECNGHIGSLRSSCDILFEHYSKAVAPVEEDVFVYYLSGIFVNQLTRCFGSGHTTPASRNLQLFLIKCLVRDPTCGPLGMQLDEDEKQCFTRLMKAGIVRQDGDGYVMFVSPLAERYYNKWLFPHRADCNPKSLRELIRKVIGSMSASVLRQSVVYTDNFPKEAAFQHQFMAALALHTLQTCYICPELSRVFPDSPRQLDQRINGEIDFYLNGSLRWGIELLVNGDGIGEHMARFAEDGKYAALAVKDYAVVDLRCNQTGRITNVIRKPERITVFFKVGDFSSCRCIFGLDENPEPIVLGH